MIFSLMAKAIFAGVFVILGRLKTGAYAHVVELYGSSRTPFYETWFQWARLTPVD